MSQPITTLRSLQKELRRHAAPARAAVSRRFFKTGPGQYGEGDVFIGVTVPDMRTLVRQSDALTIDAALKLLRSKIHEERLVALLLLVRRYGRGSDSDKRKIHRAYLANTKFINNWDLVDSSAEYIVGDVEDISLLMKLARSKHLWERRIAIVSTFHFIKRKNCTPTFRIAKMLLKDRHDLIHKATGWMLREVGKKCGEKTLKMFLDRHASVMPRTMLRYAIERLPVTVRRRYTQT